MTTALLRRIADEDEDARQLAWAERKEHGRAKRNPRWAVDHLLSVGQITADQHDAAKRLQSCLERSQPGYASGCEMVDGSRSDPHARLWDAAVCSSAVRQARIFVMATRSASKNRMLVMDKLFAFPAPTMAQMQRSASGSKLPYDYACKRIRHVLELLEIHWRDADRAYGR